MLVKEASDPEHEDESAKIYCDNLSVPVIMRCQQKFIKKSSSGVIASRPKYQLPQEISSPCTIPKSDPAREITKSSIIHGFMIVVLVLLLGCLVMVSACTWILWYQYTSTCSIGVILHTYVGRCYCAMSSKQDGGAPTSDNFKTPQPQESVKLQGHQYSGVVSDTRIACKQPRGKEARRSTTSVHVRNPGTQQHQTLRLATERSKSVPETHKQHQELDGKLTKIMKDVSGKSSEVIGRFQLKQMQPTRRVTRDMFSSITFNQVSDTTRHLQNHINDPLTTTMKTRVMVERNVMMVPALSKKERSEEDEDDDDDQKTSSFTQDFTSLSLQGDSCQRPVKKGGKMDASGSRVHKVASSLLCHRILFAACSVLVSAFLLVCTNMKKICSVCSTVKLLVTASIWLLIIAAFSAFPKKVRNLKIFQDMEVSFVSQLLQVVSQAERGSICFIVIACMMPGHPEMDDDCRNMPSGDDSAFMSLFLNSEEDLVKYPRDLLDSKSVNSSIPIELENIPYISGDIQTMPKFNEIEDYPDATQSVRDVGDQIVHKLQRNESHSSMNSSYLNSEDLDQTSYMAIENSPVIQMKTPVVGDLMYKLTNNDFVEEAIINASEGDDKHKPDTCFSPELLPDFETNHGLHSDKDNVDRGQFVQNQLTAYCQDLNTDGVDGNSVDENSENQDYASGYQDVDVRHKNAEIGISGLGQQELKTEVGRLNFDQSTPRTQVARSYLDQQTPRPKFGRSDLEQSAPRTQVGRSDPDQHTVRPEVGRLRLDQRAHGPKVGRSEHNQQARGPEVPQRDVLSVKTPPNCPASVDERLIVDNKQPPKRKYQWRDNQYITGEVKTIMLFLLGIESAIDGSGVFLKLVSPLFVDDGRLQSWKIPHLSDENSLVYFDKRSDVLYCVKRIPLSIFLKERRLYEIYISEQLDDFSRLTVYGVTKSHANNVDYVDILYQYRKTTAADNIKVFVCYLVNIRGRIRTTGIEMTIPRWSTVKSVMQRQEVERLKELVLTLKPQLEGKLYVKMTKAGQSCYPSPTYKLCYNNITLEIIPSLP